MKRRSPRWIVVVAASAAFLSLLAVGTAPALADCPDRPTCSGCGCKGGPGYRGPDGKCVGFKNLNKICGSPPTRYCIFENAPGTGANHDCALGLDDGPEPIKED